MKYGPSFQLDCSLGYGLNILRHYKDGNIIPSLTSVQIWELFLECSPLLDGEI